MPEFLTPGVYTESVSSNTNVIEQLSSTTGAIIGKFKSGPSNKATLITSWANFKEKFGKGLSTVFDSESYAAYAVYGFFQNGGKSLYVVRSNQNSVKATGSKSTYQIDETPHTAGTKTTFEPTDVGFSDKSAVSSGVFTLTTPTSNELTAFKDKDLASIKMDGTTTYTVKYTDLGAFNIIADGGSNNKSTLATITFNAESSLKAKIVMTANLNTGILTVQVTNTVDGAVNDFECTFEDTQKYSGDGFIGAIVYDSGTTNYWEDTAESLEYQSSLDFEALYEGTYLNSAKVSVSESDGLYTYKLTTATGELLESFTSSTIEKLKSAVVSGSTYVNVIELAGEGEFTFAGGSNGTYYNALSTEMLKAFDEYKDDISMIISPDYTTKDDCNILISYATDNDMLAIIQGEGTEDVAGIRSFRASLSSGNGALYYPYIQIKSADTGEIFEVPPCGHIMGNYAKVITNRGVWKNPAGVEYPLVGVVGTAKISSTQANLNTADTDILNPLSVNCILSRPNYGICVWGCRTLHSDDLMRYVADIMLKCNTMKSIDAGTQNLVFEPIDNYLYTKATTSVQSYLDTLWRQGAFYGSTASEAYYVQCNEDNNPEEQRDRGILLIECGYAQKKPAEFVHIKIAHQIPSNE